MAVLAGRVAVVTGASAGIGAGLAAMLAAEGATVVLAAGGKQNWPGWRTAFASEEAWPFRSSPT